MTDSVTPTGDDAHPLDSLGQFDDNGPPIFVVDAVDQLKRELAPFAVRKDEFLQKLSKVLTIRDRHDVGAAADLTGFAEDVGAMVDAARRKVGDPHSEAWRAVNAAAADFWAPVRAELARLQGMVNSFVAEEKRRIKEQADEQRAFEARLRSERSIAEPHAAPPLAPAAPKRQYRGEYGRQAIVQDDYHIEIVDPRAMPDYIFETDKVREAIVAAAKVFRKQGIREITGLIITTGVKTQMRR